MAYLNIDRNECIGDSLSKINSNASNFDARLSTLANTDTSITTAINNLSAQLVPVGATCIFQDQKSSGSSGGTSPSTAGWLKRTLNNTLVDTDNLRTINDNQFTLPAGTWLIQARVPCYEVSNAQARIVDTAGPTYYYGMTNYADNGGPVIELTAVATVTIPPGTTKTFYIDQYLDRTNVTYGLGYPNSIGVDEIYTTVVCIKIR